MKRIDQSGSYSAWQLLVVLIVFVFLTDIVVLLDIPFLRQIFGFIFLTILPGILILDLLKLKIDFLERFILTWGLSVSFLMLFGLLINDLSLYLGYETPLATIPLLILFNIVAIALIPIAYRMNKNKNVVLSLPNLNLTTTEKAFLVVPILFPALSIFGMHVLNTTDNNTILMILLFLIPVYVAFVCFFNHKFPKRLYPVVIFLISISLLLLLSLRSNHIIGMDVHLEYYLFQTTLNNLHWGVSGNSLLDACLCISLLPTIYQSFLNITPEFLFKILYSLLYSVSPLVIYVISKKYVKEGYAFLASCFFMSQAIFLLTAYSPRTNIAILFFALAMMILFSDKIDPLKKRILFIVFMASCMVSHYSTTYIFFIIMLGAFVGMEILSKRYTFKKLVSLTIVVLFFAMIFFWYSQVTETAFNSGVGFVEETLMNLNRFFVEEAKGGGTQALFGEDIVQKGIPHKIEFVFTWLTFALIGIGVITLMIKYKDMSFPERDFKKLDFLKDKFEVGYFVVALTCSGLLVAIVSLPYISIGYSLNRTYAIAITILSVFFVIGGIIISKHFFFFEKRKPVLKEKHNCFFGKPFFSKERFDGKNGQQTQNGSEVRAYLVILMILIPYFFCVTGVMYNIFGVPRAIILNSDGEQYDMLYVHDQESYGARWLRDKCELKNTKIYVDCRTKLISQAGILRCCRLEDKEINGYIYLGYPNVVDGEILCGQKGARNMIEYQAKFVGKRKIYTNGGSEIYR